MIKLSDLMEQLEEDVPARKNVPSASQYERCVLDAAMDFSNRCGRVKRATLDIVAGTATYALPEDFLRMIALASLVQQDGILNTAMGLIPVMPDWQERYSIAGGMITFEPTPGYTLSRQFTYKAGWALTMEGEDYPESNYTDMTEDEGRIVLLKATALALKTQANSVALDGWKYSIGDESVDKSGQGAAIKQHMDTIDADYLKAVESYNGTAGGLHG